MTQSNCALILRGMAVPAQRMPVDRVHADVLAARAGDRRAGDRVIRSVAKMVRLLAAEIHDSTKELIDDLEQVGYLGVWKAISSWEPERGTLFSTWAYLTARGYMLHHVHQMLAVTTGPWRSSIADRLAQRSSVDAKDLAAPDSDPEETLMVVLQDAADRQLLHKALAGLEERHRDVLQRRLRGDSLRDIGADSGVSKARAGQIATVALRALISSLRPELDDLQVARMLRDLRQWQRAV